MDINNIIKSQENNLINFFDRSLFSKLDQLNYKPDKQKYPIKQLIKKRLNENNSLEIQKILENLNEELNRR